MENGWVGRHDNKRAKLWDSDGIRNRLGVLWALKFTHLKNVASYVVS